jgi:hypothetical protein
VACRAGCDHCCYQAVGVTAPEALAIVAHLRSALSAAELATFASPRLTRERAGSRPRRDSRSSIPVCSSSRPAARSTKCVPCPAAA